MEREHHQQIITYELGDNAMRLIEKILNSHKGDFTAIKKLLGELKMNQQQFDAKLKDIQDAITAEAAQVQAFIAAAPPSLDTSALDSVVANIDGIFPDAPNVGSGGSTGSTGGTTPPDGSPADSGAGSGTTGTPDGSGGTPTP